MTPKETQFIGEYLQDLNATQAAIRAGYSARTANRIASRLLSKADVAAEIARRKSLQIEKADLSAARVLEELRRLSFSDVRRLFDEKGNLKPLKDLTAEEASSIASIDVVKRNITTGDGEIDTVIKIKTWDKTRSLETLAKHFALLTEVVKVTDEGGLIEKLHAGRRRAAEAHAHRG